MTSLVSLIQGIAKQNLDVLRYTKAVLSESLDGEQLNLTKVEEILTQNDKLNSLLPQSLDEKQEVYKVVASQVRLLQQVGESGLINEAIKIVQQEDDLTKEVVDLLGLLREKQKEVLPAVQEFACDLSQSKTGEELLLEIGLTQSDLATIAQGKIDPKLIKKILPLLQKGIDAIADNPGMKDYIEKSGLTPEELKKIVRGDIKPETFKKFLNLLQTSDVTEFLEKAGVSPVLLKALPLLIGKSDSVDGVGGAVGALLQNPEAKELLDALGIQIGTTDTPSTTTTNNNKPGSKGWGNGFGTWIVGGISVGLAGVGFFVEDNIMKTFFVALGAFGIGGSIIGSFEAPRKFFGAAN